MPKFLTEPVGSTVDEMLTFCHEALAYLESLELLLVDDLLEVCDQSQASLL